MVSFGNAMLWSGLLTTLLSLIAYAAANRGKQDARQYGRTSFTVSAVAVFLASLILLLGFLQHRFEISYVAEYSSRALPLLYRVSAFWAGQEGSFLLWALLGAGIGLALIRKAGRWEGPVMVIFTAVQAFVLLLLLVKSPFQLAEMPLEDGQGLNPLLQDPWMAIHPPLIFLGYAALAVPFAFAVAALARRDYERWVSRALPWTLFAWTVLGAGIFIGGYWAYRVLGWGGYWGWDPVENASLIPWLLSTALLHGMLLQRARGSLKRGNLLLAVGSFVMVLYGTFLTRSGVLKDFSVHSFVDPGMALYWTMLGGVVLALASPLLLFLGRAKEIQSTPTYDNLLSRDFAFFLGTLVLCISAAIVTVGTSAPIITSLLGKPTSIRPEFYNRTHFPVGVLLALLVGTAPLLSWRQSAVENITRRLWPHLLVTAAGAALAAAVGVHNGWMLLLIAASVFGFSVNLTFLGRVLRGAPLSTGGYLAHVGLALALIGIVGSSVYSRSEKIAIQPGKSAEALGYRVTYIGSERPDDTRRQMKLTLARGGTEFTATPKMVYSPQMDSWVHSPALKKYWLQDLYVSPVEFRDSTEAAAGTAELAQGQAVSEAGYTFTFEKFDMGGQMGASGMSVGAVIQVKKPDGKTVSVTPTTSVSNGGSLTPNPATVPGTDVTVSVVGIAVPKIRLSVAGLSPAKPAGGKEEVVVEVSSKPLINLLWLGTILVLAGGLTAGVRRTRESARIDQEEQLAEATNAVHKKKGKRQR